MNHEEVEDLIDCSGRVFPSTGEPRNGLVDLFRIVAVEFSDKRSWADSSEPVFGERTSGETVEVLGDDRVGVSCDRQTGDVLVFLVDADDHDRFVSGFDVKGVREGCGHRSDGVGTESFGVDIGVVGENVSFEFFEDFAAPSQLECIEAGEGREEVA